MAAEIEMSLLPRRTLSIRVKKTLSLIKKPNVFNRMLYHGNCVVSDLEALYQEVRPPSKFSLSPQTMKKDLQGKIQEAKLLPMMNRHFQDCYHKLRSIWLSCKGTVQERRYAKYVFETMEKSRKRKLRRNYRVAARYLEPVQEKKPRFSKRSRAQKRRRMKEIQKSVRYLGVDHVKSRYLEHYKKQKEQMSQLKCLWNLHTKKPHRNKNPKRKRENRKLGLVLSLMAAANDRTLATETKPIETKRIETMPIETEPIETESSLQETKSPVAEKFVSPVRTPLAPRSMNTPSLADDEFVSMDVKDMKITCMDSGEFISLEARKLQSPVHHLAVQRSTQKNHAKAVLKSILQSNIRTLRV